MNSTGCASDPEGTYRSRHVSLLTIEDHLVGKGESVMWGYRALARKVQMSEAAA
jgi:hypothetical protein